MRAGHASFRRAGCAAGASGGRDVVGSASRRRQASTRLAGRGDWRRRLAALSLVCGDGRGGRTDEQSVTSGRPEWSGVRTWSRRGDGDAGSGISRDDRSPVRAARRRGSRLGESRDVRGGGRCGPRLGGDGAPQAERQRGAEWREAERHRLRANYQGRSPERASVVRRASGASDGVEPSDQRERAKTDRGSVDVAGGEDAGAWFAERAERAMALSGATNGSGRRRTGEAWTLRVAKTRQRGSPSERSERWRFQAARSSWSFLNQTSSLRRRRRASGVHLARGSSSVRR